MKKILFFEFMLVCTALGRSVFISKKEASQYLSRTKRANSKVWRFEEVRQGNAERECMEETCSYEEAREVFENDRLTAIYWRRLTDQCNSDLNSCNVNGTYSCQSGRYSHICLCKSGFAGTRCDEKIFMDSVTVCDKYDNLCRNGGTCVDDEEDTYYCLCPPGWYGIDCSQDIDECENHPCLHGQCRNSVGSYQCSCYIGYQGRNCEIEQP